MWPRLWQAKWIWWEPPPEQGSFFRVAPIPRRPDGLGYLRRTFHLSGSPERARCRVTADGRYILWVNGSLIGRGPSRSEPSHLTFDTYDVTASLRSGHNCLAVLARNYGGNNVYWKPAPAVGDIGFGGLLLECAIELEDAPLLVKTDQDWKVRPAPYERPDEPTWAGHPAIEVLDGRKIPHGWTEAGYDDADWHAAQVLSPSTPAFIRTETPNNPFALLGPRRIPPLAERIIQAETVVATGTVAADHDGLLDASSDLHPDQQPQVPAQDMALEPDTWITLDLGGIVNGHPRLELKAQEGTVLDITGGEDIDPDGRPITPPRRWRMRYTTHGQDGEQVESFEPVGFRYLSVAAREGRIHSLAGSVRERTYPVAEGAYFRCSDRGLDQIWRSGARSLELCATDAFLDCPGREVRAWLGDAYVHVLVTLICNGDPGMAAHHLRLAAEAPRTDGLLPMVAAGDLTDAPSTITDYSLHWIRALARLWEYTADLEIVDDLLPTALNIVRCFERFRGSDGLLTDTPGWVFIDWAWLERGRQQSALDALYAATLDDLATLADAAEAPRLARTCRSRASVTRDAFERYWDPERGVYVDAADPGGTAGRRVSQHANAMAILAGCVTADRASAIIPRILDPKRARDDFDPDGSWPDAEMAPDGFDEEEHVVEAQPFFMHFVHQAVVRAGHVDMLPELMRRWHDLDREGHGTLDEVWTTKPGSASRCHAWSATPTYDLSTHVLGIQPSEPGFAGVKIEPHLGELDWAEGAVPTPRGWVRARIEGSGDGWLELPDGCTGIVRLPEREISVTAGRTVFKEGT